MADSLDFQNEEQKKEESNKSSETPMLDNFGRDLTKLATEGKLDKIVGREVELDRMIQILGRRKKNNPILVGASGVGKTTLIEGLAQRIVEQKVSRILFDKKIIALDMGSLVAGTKYRGQFEERIKNLIDELEQNPNIIIFMDEIHTMIGAGNSPGSLDASNMLKPALSRGLIQLIGATTTDEYKKSIERDAALERRFQKMFIDPSSAIETRQILENIKDRYEEYHLVSYSNESLDACVKFSDRYITTRYFPDKAIDIMDEVGSRVHIDNINVPKSMVEKEQELKDIIKNKVDSVKKQDFEEAASFRDKEKLIQEELKLMKQNWKKESEKNKIIITEEDVAKVVSKMCGIPVTKMTEDEGKKVVNMNKELQERIIGQDDAVEKICEAIQRSRAGLQNSTKPIFTGLFIGKSGVGKTELCKELARYLFHSKEHFIKLDMSEYMEPHSIAKMIGSPPGYIGYDEGGQLTELVKNKPYCVVLFDEIEKAHSSVYNLLLQIMDEGRLTDGLGRTVDFKNTIVIMTSNVGTKELVEIKSVGFDLGNAKEQNDSSIIEKALKKKFRPEFLNRIDEQIFFKTLSKENVIKIADIHLAELFDKVKEHGLICEATQNLKDLLVEEGYNEEYGARPMLRAITKYVQNPISKQILLHTFKNGDNVIVDYDKEKQEVIVKLKGKEKAKR